MAYSEYSEEYNCAYVDLDDRTITEVFGDDVRVYDLDEFLKKLESLGRVDIIIKSGVIMPPDVVYDNDCENCKEREFCQDRYGGNTGE